MISVSSQTTTRLAGAPAAARSAIVLGGGIAGLAVAEVLSRNHHRVTLIERQDALGGEASLRTQKWLHSGWLYAALPYRSAMRADVVVLADVPDAPEPDIEPVVEKACRRLGVSTSLVAGRYYGIKTEYTGALDRRYNHAVAQVNGNTWLTLAGKLSQFPLLVADFARHLSLRIDLPASAGRCQSPDLVAPTVPESIVNDHAARAELARERAGMVAKA